MMGNGLDENGKKTYTEYLGVEDIEMLNAINKTLLEELPEVDNTSKMMLSNSIWVNKLMGVSLNDGYSNLMVDMYNVASETLPFENSAKNIINQWCSDQTDGLIPNFLEDINPECYAMFLNALVFKSTWKDDIFKASNTTDGSFYGADKTVKVKMMHSDLTHGIYLASERFENFRLDFGNGAYYLNIIMPKDMSSVKDLNDILIPDNYAREFPSTDIRKMYVALPRFTIESSVDINKILSFANKTNLLSGFEYRMFKSVLTNADIQYRQAVTLSLDESGAEVSAVSSGELSETSPMPMPTVEITVDKPFIFFIKEVSTGACILSGKVSQL